MERDVELRRLSWTGAQRVAQHLRAALSAPRSLGRRLDEISLQLDRLGRDAVTRLSALDRLDRSFMEHVPVWDADHRLHETMLRRLSAIERSVGPSEGAVGTSDANVAAMATMVRDFLGVAGSGDRESTMVKIGPLEVEIPAWDTVILPWVRAYGDWEPAVRRILEGVAGPGDVVVEVGAHVGIFTLTLSALVGPGGRVVAVEADPLNARFLRRNIARSHCANVIVLEVAATDRTGVVKLSRSIEDNTGDSRTYVVRDAGQVLEVASVALDDVVAGRVDVVKVDLQGMDHVAIRGMSRLIDEHRPVIVMEFWPAGIREFGDDPVQVLGWLRGLGYSWTAVEAAEISDARSDEDVCAATEALATGFCDLVMHPKHP